MGKTNSLNISNKIKFPVVKYLYCRKTIRLCRKSAAIVRFKCTVKNYNTLDKFLV